MNNSISFGGAEVLGGINNGQAFFSPHCTLPTSHHRVITPLAKEHTVGGRDKEGQGERQQNRAGVPLLLLRASGGRGFCCTGMRISCRASSQQVAIAALLSGSRTLVLGSSRAGLS